ncbi:lipid-A-disaccharide synthase [Oxalobacter formigenes]|uniref:Lipid-A-disaccharide synthase n=1 Tax=Oxalobacter formigenes OXCC13 TaxID=556269 RepID=C3X7S5_OXAFO|nr:lipid-A-disaccharide synthase [Oxalobacter formigenes]ARQ46736.1 Lipid-A-disaccharide synthase [Oxalobacter formigenes]ARQ78800.1 lipid-A-disaccharide synthase [Oxalobacter formigenes OXCC13]EEO29251.1 lipid-A-disaccharide synthase [Oxalobacter formigenes OXCC13]MCZ4062596.1 lipid-A-disaccharide synthase [Oxalobacter formigenes]QDX32623.1 lipid-A-disaccharide synthase [Oxalobacter formigenes]
MVAGETSGDLLGANLLSALRPQLPDTLMHGIGGPQMAKYDFVSNWPMEKLSVNGLFEVLAHYREIKGIHNHLRDHLLAQRPDVFVGIDSPEFNLSLELALKKAGIKTVHFVSPSVWAWRSGRIRKIAEAVSRILVLFPFEEAIYQKAGIPVTYVGHPLAESIPMRPDIDAARTSLGLDREKPVITIMPGSRMSELKYNSPAFVESAKILLQRDPTIQFVIPMAGDEQLKYFTKLVSGARLDDLPLQIVRGHSHAAITAADAVLVASGTATLEVALFKKPMVIAYKLMRATWEIARHIVKPPVGLPNILAGEMIVPELLQNAATGQALADALWFQLTDQANRQRLEERFIAMHYSLLRNTAQTSADAILEVMNGNG